MKTAKSPSKGTLWMLTILLISFVPLAVVQAVDRGANALNGNVRSNSSNRLPLPTPTPTPDPNPPPTDPTPNPGPLKITPGTPTLNSDASQEIYPDPDDSGLILQNGDFSLPDLNPDDPAQPDAQWHNQTFTSIQGWTAISPANGGLIELQNNFNGSDQDQQWCELDSDWPRGQRGQGSSHHGIQQYKVIKKGSYILVFDYKGRTANNIDNQPVTAAAFTVKADPDDGEEKTLVDITGASTMEWKRAYIPFNMGGGDSEVTQEQVNFTIDIPAGTADSIGPLIDNVILLPVEIKVASSPYAASSSFPRGPVDNIISAWPGDSTKLVVNFPLDESWMPPPNFIEWSVPGPGNEIPVNERKPTVSWTNPGAKQLLVKVGGNYFHIVIDVPDVGSLSEVVVSALDPVGAALAIGYASDAQNWAASALPDDHNNAGSGKANALQHSAWNAFMASDILLQSSGALFFSKAHEFSNRGLAYDSTMDLHNNVTGAEEVHSILGIPNYSVIKSALLARLHSGDLWIIAPLSEREIGHVIKSNGKKVYNFE